jgi:hypothetical protein
MHFLIIAAGGGSVNNEISALRNPVCRHTQPSAVEKFRYAAAGYVGGNGQYAKKFANAQ